MTRSTQPRQRTTRQRVAVAESLAESGEFRSAQEIHASLRESGAAVGLATVYRNLGQMADLGEVDTLVRYDGETLYRQCSDVHHHHLVCRECGRTVEIAGPAVERWANRVAAEHGFTDVSHQLELFGTCAQCAQTRVTRQVQTLQQTGSPEAPTGDSPAPAGRVTPAHVDPAT